LAGAGGGYVYDRKTQKKTRDPKINCSNAAS